MTVPWRVLLVGGGAGTGKSTTARTLGRQLAVPTLLVDDIRIGLQAVTTAAEHPALHAFLHDGSPAYASPAAFCEGLFNVATALVPALRVIVSHHLAVAEAGPVIIEGDGILPSLVSDVRDPRCRAVFLHAPATGVVLENLRARGGGFAAMPAERQSLIAEGSWQYGAALAKSALETGLPVVEAAPLGSLHTRILNIIGPAEASAPITA